METQITTIAKRKPCKKCEKGVLDTRTPRPVLMKMTLFWLPIKRYRCSICDKKSYVFGSSWQHIKQQDMQPAN